MAKLTSYQRLDTRTFDVFSPTDRMSGENMSIAPDMAHPDQKFYVYPGSSSVLTFRGHDFDYFDERPIGGTITSIERGHNPTAGTYVLDYKLQGLNEDLLQFSSFNPFDAFDGRDTIVGSKYGDRIDGFDGSDKLTGGAGADTFYFTTDINATNIDRITDFRHGTDKIALEKDIFQGITRANLSASFHDITKSAEQSDDHILYNKKTGWLSYDVDGKGGHAPVHFATLDHHPTVTSGDFLLV